MNINLLFYKINNYITLSWSASKTKRLNDLQNVSEHFNVEMPNNLQLYMINTLKGHLTPNFTI
jgi:hypothetical protein